MVNDKLELSVVLPCLNEEAALGDCCATIMKVLKDEGIVGEIIVVDNGSTDRSREIAAAYKARVFDEPIRGYGAAYMRGLAEARGQYIIIGDSDNSYDFKDIPKFLALLRNGYDFVMGSRFKGTIQKGAMPWTNRYIGNPVLSGMCRLFFRTSLSDIHCGMRAFTREAYQRMHLVSLGMEFATEMVVAALTANLKIAEIPITYHPRSGESKLNPLFDAWRHVRFMLIFCPVWLYFIPGLIGFFVGLTGLLLLLHGPVFFLGHGWDLHFMMFASIMCILSYQVLNVGVFAHTYAIRQGFLKFDPVTRVFQRTFSLEKGLALGGVIFLVGLLITLSIFMEWFSRNFGSLYRIREAILAMTLLVIGIQTIFSSFFISFLFLEKR